MGYTFGEKSTECLNQIHPKLQQICMEAIQRIDFAITCGYRGKEEQAKKKLEGSSNANFGQSAHNFKPAMAFDFLPFENNKQVSWENYAAFQRVIDVLKTVAKELKIDIRTKVILRYVEDKNKGKVPVYDWPHVEILNWKMRNG